jgi:hypothetical protein
MHRDHHLIRQRPVVMPGQGAAVHADEGHGIDVSKLGQPVFFSYQTAVCVSSKIISILPASRNPEAVQWGHRSFHPRLLYAELFHTILPGEWI